MSDHDRMDKDDQQDKNARLKALFDTVASQYEGNRFFQISAREFATFIKPSASGQLLDVATGTGLVALQMAERHKDLHITGIDLSHGMLQEAIRVATEKGYGARIDFRQMDAMALQFEEAQFDYVTCSYGIFFLPDMADGLREFLRVLKPGGRLVFSSFCENSFSPFRDLFMKRAAQYGFEPSQQSWMALSSAERIHRFMKGIPVADYSIEQREIRYEITPEDWWSTVLSTGYRAILSQVGESKIPEFKDAHMSELHELAKQQTLLMNADSFYITIAK